MKFYVRRFILGIVSAPILFAVYGIGYFYLGYVAVEDTARIEAFTSNLFSIGLTWVLVITFQPQFSKLIDKMTTESN